MRNILLVVALSFQIQAFAAISSQDQKISFTQLNMNIQNSNLSMAKRWESLIKAAEVANDEQLTSLVKLAKNKEWFIRNGLLVALDKLGTDHVYQVAKTLITDKSLVVRSASVDILARMNSPEVRKVLLTEMNKKYNFVGQKSLWIRSQILEKLIQKPTSNENAEFAKLLFDRDNQIATMSIVALEKTTQVRFSGADKLIQWQNYAKNQKLF